MRYGGTVNPTMMITATHPPKSNHLPCSSLGVMDKNMYFIYTSGNIQQEVRDLVQSSPLSWCADCLVCWLPTIGSYIF